MDSGWSNSEMIVIKNNIEFNISIKDKMMTSNANITYKNNGKNYHERINNLLIQKLEDDINA